VIRTCDTFSYNLKKREQRLVVYWNMSTVSKALCTSLSFKYSLGTSC